MEIEPVDVVGIRGRDFVIYDEEQRPRFEARVLDGTNTLKVLWTNNIGWTLYWLRQVQRLMGGPGSFDRIEGFATDEFANAIQRGLLDEPEIANRVMRALGGRWTTRTSAQRDDWIDVIVTRDRDD
jgi:hypothetical protein